MRVGKGKVAIGNPFFLGVVHEEASVSSWGGGFSVALDCLLIFIGTRRKFVVASHSENGKRGKSPPFLLSKHDSAKIKIKKINLTTNLRTRVCARISLLIVHKVIMDL